MANAIYPKWKEAALQSTADADLDGSGTTGVWAALIDTGFTGLPVTPNGGNITVTWNASGIFTL